MQTLLEKLDSLDKLANSSKLNRLLFRPFHYLKGQVYSKFIYPITKKGIFVTSKTFFGYPMQLLLPAGLDIYLLGCKTHGSEIRLAKYLINSLRHGDTFLDVGAHFGYYSLLSSQLVGQSGQVFSFEASPNIYKILCNNKSNYPTIQAFNMACADKDEMLTFHEFPILYSEYNTISPEQFEHSSWISKNEPRQFEIEGRSLDNVMNEMHIKPNFIKIDVEGAEYKVIKGLENALKTMDDLTLSMEYIRDSQQASIYSMAISYLEKYEFIPHYIDKKGVLNAISTSVMNYLERTHQDSDNIIFKKIQSQ